MQGGPVARRCRSPAPRPRASGWADSWPGAARSNAERARLERLRAEDVVIAGIARDHQPSLAGIVVPELAMGSCRVVAEIDVVDEALQRVRRLRVGAPDVGVAQIAELAQVALTAMGAVD